MGDTTIANDSKQLKLDSRLFQYSLTIGTSLATTMASADIIANAGFSGDIVLDSPSPFDTFFVDINQDGTNNFEFRVFRDSASSSSRFMDFNQTGGVQNEGFVRLGVNLGFEVSPLDAGFVIGPALETAYTWEPGYGSGGAMFGDFSSSGSGLSFSNVGLKYLGVRFRILGDTHYGWIGVNADTTTQTLTISGWAYNDTPNESIIAGAVPEPSAYPVGLGLLALGAAGIRRYRSTRLSSGQAPQG